MKFKKITTIMASLLILPTLLFGCGSTSTSTEGGDTASAEGAQKYVAIVSKGYQHEFWKTVEKGAQTAGEEVNLKVTFEGPDNETMVDKQIEMVENAITKKADIIMLAPLDSKALLPVVQKAEEKGIPVITFDSDLESDIQKSFIATDNKAAGAVAAKETAKLMDNKGQVAIVAHNEGTSTAQERRDGFKEEIEANYPDIEIVSIQYSDGDHAKALSKATDIMTSNPELKAIYATNEGAAIGVATAVKEKGKADVVKVVGFDSSEQEIKFLEEGAITGFVVQNPYNMGYLGVKAASDLLDGKTIEKRIDTGATYVNKDNMKDEEIQKLLYPMGKN
ncbi:MAG: ABC transporter substrate-binding protein [Clostridium sp.]